MNSEPTAPPDTIRLCHRCLTHVLWQNPSMDDMYCSHCGYVKGTGERYMRWPECTIEWWLLTGLWKRGSR